METWLKRNLKTPWMALSLFDLDRDPVSLANGNRRVQTSPERYLELATECMKKVYNMGPLQLHHNLCQYLSLRLLFAIQAAHRCKSRIDSGPRGFMEWCRGILKVLLRLAREVESFIRACCSDQWIRHAIIFTNMLEYVSLLGFELNTCRGALLDEAGTCNDVENTLKRPSCKGADVKTVKLRFNSDRSRLLKNMEALVHSSHPSTQEFQLATFLLGRWTGMRIPDSIGSSSASFLEVDYESLEQVEKLGGGSSAFVHKTLWLGVHCAEKTFFGSNHPSFRNEVSILEGLSHPNIVPLFCYAMDNRQCSIVMELMEGDLFHHMQTRLRYNKMDGSRTHGSS